MFVWLDFWEIDSRDSCYCMWFYRKMPWVLLVYFWVLLIVVSRISWSLRMRLAISNLDRFSVLDLYIFNILSFCWGGAVIVQSYQDCWRDNCIVHSLYSNKRDVQPLLLQKQIVGTLIKRFLTSICLCGCFFAWWYCIIFQGSHFRVSIGHSPVFNSEITWTEPVWWSMHLLNENQFTGNLFRWWVRIMDLELFKKLIKTSDPVGFYHSFCSLNTTPTI